MPCFFAQLGCCAKADLKRCATQRRNERTCHAVKPSFCNDSKVWQKGEMDWRGEERVWGNASRNPEMLFGSWTPIWEPLPQSKTSRIFFYPRTILWHAFHSKLTINFKHLFSADFERQKKITGIGKDRRSDEKKFCQYYHKGTRVPTADLKERMLFDACNFFGHANGCHIPALDCEHR